MVVIRRIFSEDMDMIEAWDGGAVTPPNQHMRPERNAVKAG